ncbi:DGQHR domain-containing protein [Streptomyces mutabilis]|uniref:DGQHR domain-containing protein n=1 Tax=Streptomyces mutabilis TaxID=67332 RepID=UPI0034DF6B2F
MGSKTFIPAFEAKVGNWKYYSCLMKYAQVAREIQFAHEIGGNQDLGTMIQRGISARTKEITDYLLTNENRFLGSLIVAVWGGHPEYTPLEMSADAEKQEMLEGIDRNFGVLTFDGTHQYFALDGQHRLKAIKDAVRRDSSLLTEDISVIVVPHFDTDEGRQRTRRLFTNINRNVKTTTPQENLALDEDDGFSILTRRLLDEHQFLGRDDVVRVFTRQGQEGDLRLALKQVPISSPSWTTIGSLYDIVREVGFGLHPSMYKKEHRATDDVLDESYGVIVERLEELLDACGDLRKKYEASAAPEELRAPRGRDGDGHAFMRPVVQAQVAKALRSVIESDLIDWHEAMERLRSLNWRIGSHPFSAVWIPTPESSRKGKMAANKESSTLLYDLLLVHLAPTSKAQITRALRAYKDLQRETYPVTAEDLGSLLTERSQGQNSAAGALGAASSPAAAAEGE